MKTAVAEPVTDPAPATPTGKMLTGALIVAPLIYLAADSTYAARGWDDGTAGVLHGRSATASSCCEWRHGCHRLRNSAPLS
jgi:hypothetical protein